MGRICDGLHQYEEALGHYQMTIAHSDPNKYYACSASLQSGVIYEKKKNKPKAEAFYRKCLSLHPDEYATSLHQKAQTGLQRLK
jgi:tetratricopeptide (TPR) repeat protein